MVRCFVEPLEEHGHGGEDAQHHALIDGVMVEAVPRTVSMRPVAAPARRIGAIRGGGKATTTAMRLPRQLQGREHWLI